jgi:hypothetical protein
MRRLFAAAFACVLALYGPALAAPGIAINPDLLTACNQAQIYDASTSGSTRLVVGAANTQIYVCGFNFWSNGTANVGLVYGTGGTCGSGTTEVTPAFHLTAQSGNVDHISVYGGLPPVPSSNDLCLNVSAGVAVQAIVYYTQF